MYYEIYIDTLLLVNFVMNLYCLELVNVICMRTATRRRVVLGSVLGAVMYLIPFCIPGVAWIKLLFCFPLAAGLMIGVTFHTASFGAFIRVVGLMLLASLAFGGCMIMLVRIFPMTQGIFTKILGVMGAGALICMEISYLLQKSSMPDLCTVELFGKGAGMTVNALIDTGNGLFEPISGKPVCILEKRVFENLWANGRPEGFRVIPYHSVGKSNGILYGYLIPRMRVKRNGIVIQLQNIYVGIVEEKLTENGRYPMIINPLLLSGQRKTG